jgi:hypothetical protein
MGRRYSYYALTAQFAKRILRCEIDIFAEKELRILEDLTAKG